MRRLLWLVALSVVGCSGSRTLTILHTNDIHGRFMPERATWRADSAMVGGFAALSGALDSVRRADKNTIFLDAGDLMTGNPICNIEVDGIEGGALLEMLNLCGCDAACLGNHEFDLGANHVASFAKSPKVDLLCANVRFKGTGASICPAYKIITQNRLRIGIIGLLLTDLAGVVSKQAVESFDVLEIASAAQPLLDELDSQTDLLILLTHNGYENDKDLARAVHGCDVIIGGHSHTRLDNPVVENGVVIVQAGSYLKQLGVLEITVKGDRVTEHSGTLVELETARFNPDPEVSAYASKFAEQIDIEYGKVIAEAATTIERRYRESSPLGNLICDLMREHYDTDFAITNSGGLRKNIAKGPIRKLDCVELMPFVNSVSLFEASGAELMKFAERQAIAQTSEKSEVLQMSGLMISYERADNKYDEFQVLVEGQPMDLDSTYRGVSIDYVLVSQADKYLGFTPRNMEGTGVLFSDFIMQAFAAAPQPLTAPDEARLIQRKP